MLRFCALSLSANPPFLAYAKMYTCMGRHEGRSPASSSGKCAVQAEATPAPAVQHPMPTPPRPCSPVHLSTSVRSVPLSALLPATRHTHTLHTQSSHHTRVASRYATQPPQLTPSEAVRVVVEPLVARRAAAPAAAGRRGAAVVLGICECGVVKDQVRPKPNDQTPPHITTQKHTLIQTQDHPPTRRTGARRAAPRSRRGR